MRERFKKNILFTFGITLLVLNVLNVSFLNSNIIVKADAGSSVSKGWFFNGWEYRKEHNITQVFLQDRFYDLSDPWTTILGNPTLRHAFQPVHTTTIVEVNMVVDGAVRKYLAYDGASPQSSPPDSEIRLYYTDDLDGQWTSYSGNPILGPSDRRYSWPSVVYVDGVFHMFLTNRIDNRLERWTSTDGISFSFQEIVIQDGNVWKNPFVWLNPNDNKWYLYWHDSSGSTEYFKVRSATNVEDLDMAIDIIVLSRTIPFGSPTVMYYNNQYWLLGETLEGGTWKIVAYYSTTSPISGFIECKNSPILRDNEACPMLFLNQDQTKAYLFTNRDSSRWYQETREVYLNTSTSETLNIKNYQVKIMVYYGSGTDYGQNVYLNVHSRTDFGDIRFTWFNYSSNSEIECNYWIEELVNGDHAVFWVKIPEISNGSDTIYIYYGKSDASTTSNGEATFEFFDDFSGDLSKWTIVSGKWQIENGELSAETNGFGQRIRANGFTFSNHAVHVKLKWISGTYFEGGPFVRGQAPNEQNNGYHTHLSAWPYLERHRIGKMQNGSEYVPAVQGTTNPSQNIWYYCVFKLYQNMLKASISPLYSAEITAVDNTFSSGTLSLFTWSASAEHVHYDDLFVRKYVEPEPSHGAWGMEEVAEYIIIDQSFVSDGRADVGSIQTVSFHAKWNNNGSDVIWGSIYVNGTEHITNNTGWISFTVTSSQIGEQEWAVTAVNCGGVTAYIQTAPNPTIIWDCIQIINGGVTKESTILGETVTIWFQATYEYDNKIFNNANGILYVNNMPMTWSITNNRWEYQYTPNTPGTKTFTISEVQDNTYGLTAINDVAGTQTITVWSTPFSIISNSTITELAFNSTTKTITFTVSGPDGTTGYANITIAKTLIENITGLTIYLDDHEIEYLATSTEYTWLIHFTYTHSTHKVTIQLSQPNVIKSSNPQQEITTLLGGIIIGILTATPLILQKVRRKTR
jgi:hypothetical protein